MRIFRGSAGAWRTYARLLFVSFLLLLFGGATSCELIVLGGKRAAREYLPDLDQSSPQSVVYLFKTELDSGNAFAALRVISNEDRPLLAIEKYDMQEEIERLGRMMRGKKITAMKIDTLSEAKHRVKAELNYGREFTFMTVKLEDVWYIASIKD